MTGVSGITEELKQMVGVETDPLVCHVEKGMIQRFAQAIGDTNPLWLDEEYASKTRYGGIIAPPTFPTALSTSTLFQKFIDLESPPERLLNVGNEIEYYQPIKAGDLISLTAKIANLKERETSTGKMLFITIEVTYKNQRGELVAREKDNIIRY